MGIGQPPLRYYRYKIVDYLPYMYEHQFIITSGRPRKIVSYNSIFDPFDAYVWGFSIGLIIAEFILLLVMQNLWSIVSAKPNPHDYIYQGFSTYFQLKGGAAGFNTGKGEKQSKQQTGSSLVSLPFRC